MLNLKYLGTRPQFVQRVASCIFSPCLFVSLVIYLILLGSVTAVAQPNCGDDFYGNDEMQPQCRYFVSKGDAAEFMALFNAGSFWADVNGDGVLNQTDVNLFQTAVATQNRRVVKIRHNLGSTYSVFLTPREVHEEIYGSGLLIFPSENPFGAAPPSTIVQDRSCYQFANLAGTRFGKAMVRPRGPQDFSTDQWKDQLFSHTEFKYLPLEPVCLNNLGDYDLETGVRVGDNQGRLDGLYLEAISGYFSGVENNLIRPNNDFRIAYPGSDEAVTREEHFWHAAVHLYYFWNDYRNRVLTPDFIRSLNLPQELEKNMLYRQHRFDMPRSTPPFQDGLRLDRPWFVAQEIPGYGPFTLLFFLNTFRAPVISTISSAGNSNYKKPISGAFSPDDSPFDALGLVAHWGLGVAAPFPWELDWSLQWQNNILAAVNDGITLWGAYTYRTKLYGQERGRLVTEHGRYWWNAARHYHNHSCGPNASSPMFPACDKAINFDNVMTWDEVVSTGATSNYFPYFGHTTNQSYANWVSSDLSGTYFAALFYDIAHKAGIGVVRADQLLWKTMSLITRTDKMPMRRYGQLIQEAARQLWPSPLPGEEGKSIYEEALRHALLYRGIAVDATFFCSDFDDIYGAADDYTCCPGAGSTEPVCLTAKPISGSNAARARTMLPDQVGLNQPQLFEVATSLYLSGQLPEGHPGAGGYGQSVSGRNGYIHPDAAAPYVAYTLMKDSRYGPHDKLIVTNDPTAATLTAMENPNFSCSQVNTAIYKCYEFMGGEGESGAEDLSNLTFFMPGHRLRYTRQSRRAINSYVTTSYEDTAPMGMRVVKALSSGFSMEASVTGEDTEQRSIRFSVVDPSYNSATDNYQWKVTRYKTRADQQVTKEVLPLSGGLTTSSLRFERNQPIEIELTRFRQGQQPETLRILDTVDNLGRPMTRSFLD